MKRKQSSKPSNHSEQFTIPSQHSIFYSTFLYHITFSTSSPLSLLFISPVDHPHPIIALNMSNSNIPPGSPALRTRSRVNPTETSTSTPNNNHKSKSNGTTTSTTSSLTNGHSNGHSNGNAQAAIDTTTKDVKQKVLSTSKEMIRIYKPTAHARVIDAKMDLHQS